VGVEEVQRRRYGGGRGHVPAVPSITAAGEVAGRGSEEPAATVGCLRCGEVSRMGA
jgi:hypothetical protein